MNTKPLIFLMILILQVGCASDAEDYMPANSAYVPDTASSSMSGLDNGSARSFPIVETGQVNCYNTQNEITCSETNFAGQDAQYTGNTPSYKDNGDGTVTDLVTGLMWQQDPGEKMTFAEAVAKSAFFDLAGYTDWRLPTIKELYSLILFDGTDVSGCGSGNTCMVTPFIDTRTFKFSYGDANAGERTIDSQFATSTKYVSTTMNGVETMFGVNFADGRIKGYPVNKTFYVLYVRGNPDYGKNNFVDNENGAVTDNATGLTWTKSDSGIGMDWIDALEYCETLNTAGSTDWRLPNVKELQSIVDYTRSPDTTNSAAIDPILNVSVLTNEAGQTDYPFYWSSTTHANSSGGGSFAAYVSFGRAMGYMNSWVDVHGAGAQRSDPKTGSASEYPQGHGPQGDAVRVQNHVRCVRGGEATITTNGNVNPPRPSMQVESTGIQPNQSTGKAGQGQINGMPPQEAITACASIPEGTACSFNIPNGTVTGTCRLILQLMACVPATHP